MQVDDYAPRLVHRDYHTGEAVCLSLDDLAPSGADVRYQRQEE